MHNLHAKHIFYHKHALCARPSIKFSQIIHYKSLIDVANDTSGILEDLRVLIS